MKIMWDNLKNKFKNMFTYEVEEIIEEVVEVRSEPVELKEVQPKPKSKPRSKPQPEQKLRQEPRQERTTRHPEAARRNSLDVKMTYQYPDRKFRFPVDVEADLQPARREKRMKPEEPVYKVNQPDPRPVFRKRERQQAKQQNNWNNRSSEKAHVNPEAKKEVKKRPFQPTEVPSPIYGFHPRQRDQAEDVNKPAFIRRTEQKEAQTSKSEENAVPVQEEKATLPEPMLQAAAQKPDLMNETVQAAEQPAKRNPIHTTIVEEEPFQQLTAEIELETADEADYAEPAAVPEAVPSSEFVRNEEAASAEQPVPFNVVMTDTDKLYLAHKQYQEREQRKPRQAAPPREPEKAVEVPAPAESEREEMPIHLLNDPQPVNLDDARWIENQQELLEKTLQHFNVKAKVVNATQGPSVTRFEVQPELGVKVSKVKNLSDDLKLNMSAKDIRIEAPIPGKNTIGIEVPNLHSQTVGLQEIFESDAFQESESPLTIGLGLSIEGTPIVTNIQKMPHGLIAGATGSGKSVCINTILLSLLYKASHEEVRFLLIDPKMVELAPYNGIPHLVSPVITDVKAATAALKWAVAEMEDRYERFVKEGVREISRYNVKMQSQGRTKEKMPFLVIVIDELADLMMVSPQDVEDAICRIAQKARACGIHLLLATQRPSVDVITGLIKANIPTRIAFSVSSQVDSRTIIDASGAERLLGKGDMLFVENGAGKSIRIQGAFVSDEEIERIAHHARSQAPAQYLFEQEELLAKVQVHEDSDELLEEAIDFVIEQNHASTSLLQRHFRIGYNRAARLIDTLEARGIINQQNGSKPRDVLVSRAQLEEMMK